jgi:thiol-disulfide isomerase/thioredoxin
MNKNFLFLLLAVVSFEGCRNTAVQISGTLSDPRRSEFIFLDELKSDNLKTIDSVKVSENGAFSFKHEIKQPAFYLLKFNKNNFLTMLIEPGEKIKIDAHHDSLNYPVSVSGSAGTEKMAEYNKSLRRTINKMNFLNRKFTENTDSTKLPALMESLDSLAQIYLNEINSYTKNYIDNNLTSLVSLVALYQQVAPNVYVLSPSKDLRYFVKVDSSLSRLYPDYEPVTALHEQVKNLVATVTGKPVKEPAEEGGATVPEIALPTPLGDTVKLSSTRGSVVLLDFWASWCTPCRLENPNLVKAYDTYHRKGFQIYQVSLDKTKEAWIKGIEYDKLGRWIHVSDVKYWKSSVVPLYKIESIPTNFLLNREGRILATNLRGASLEKKLAELFAK